MSNRVVMTGFYPQDINKLASNLQPNDEIWAIVDYWHFFPWIKPDRVYNLHTSLMRSGKAVSANYLPDGNRIFDYYQEYGERCPDATIVVNEHCDNRLVNKEEVFETKSFEKMLGVNARQLNSIMASSPAMMLLDACRMGKKNIYLHGFAMWLDSYDVITGKHRGEAVEQGIPLLWLVNKLRLEHGMTIDWPREAPLRAKYGNQAVFWLPSEVEVRYGDDATKPANITVAAD